MATSAEALDRGRELLRFRRVLVVVAHPDDAEWYIGGTLRMLANSGAETHVVVATDGESGPNRVGASDLASQRRGEQLAAADINGYSHLYFLGLPDRNASNDPNLRGDLIRIWRWVNPDIVFTFDPVFPSLPYLHTDHQGIGKVVIELHRSLDPDVPVYLWQTRRPDTAVDISSVIDVKVSALAQHASQGLATGAGRHRPFAMRAGSLFGIKYGELFRRVE
jgi:LmbE family N-acetylglucosaminyl deacetylase